MSLCSQISYPEQIPCCYLLNSPGILLNPFFLPLSLLSLPVTFTSFLPLLARTHSVLTPMLDMSTQHFLSLSFPSDSFSKPSFLPHSLVQTPGKNDKIHSLPFRLCLPHFSDLTSQVQGTFCLADEIQRSAIRHETTMKFISPHTNLIEISTFSRIQPHLFFFVQSTAWECLSAFLSLLLIFLPKSLISPGTKI